MMRGKNSSSQAMKMLRIFLGIFIVTYAVAMSISIELIKQNALQQPTPWSALRYIAPMVMLLVWFFVLLPMSFSIRRLAIAENRKTLAKIMLIVRIFLIYAAVVFSFSTIAILLGYG